MPQLHTVQRLLKYDFGNKKIQLWPFLAAFMLAFSWLQPHHYYPWPAFHTNAFVAAWMAGGLIVLWIVGIRPIEWSWGALIALLMALGVWVQWALGLIAHVADALISSTQLLGCALIIVMVRAVHMRDALQRLGDVVFSAMLIAGIASVGGALYQVLQIQPQSGLEGWDVWIMTIPDGVRAAGNVAQPNELATLLVWATIGGLWALHRKAIRLPVFILTSCYLAIGLGISQSRVGFIELLALCVAVMLKRSYFGGWAVAGAVLVALLVNALVLFNINTISELLLLDYEGRAISQLASNTARLDIYRHVLTAIVERPWFGYGMTTLAPAQWVAADQLPGLHSYFHSAHNILLDLLAWWGVPIGGLLFGLISWWVWSVIKAIKTPQYYLFLCALVVFAIHSMVELPHWSAAYLLPATVFAASLDSLSGRRAVARIGSRVYVLLITVATSVLTLTIIEYVKLERNYVQLRAEEARIRAVTEVPTVVVLTHLADYLRMSRMIARPNVSSETIAWMEQTVHGVPNYNTQLTHAVTLALNGQTQEAQKWMRRLNSVSPVSYHADYKRVWSNFQRWHPELLGKIEWPELDTQPPRGK